MQEPIDISALSYEEWLRFVFDHPKPENADPMSAWYITADVEVTDTGMFLDHATRLFREFPLVASHYSLAQIDQGIWFLLHSCAVGFGELLLDPLVPLSKRIDCVRSMYHPYADFVAGSPVEVMENCFEMWWDMLSESWWMEVRGRRRPPIDHGLHGQEIVDQATALLDALDGLQPGEDPRPRLEESGLSLDSFAQPEVSYSDLTPEERTLLDAMFETLQSILELDDCRCKYYALHGLGHLHHPGVHDLVQHFIDTRSKDDWPAESLGWLEACRDGTVM